jgi:hypothetical protein
MGFFLEISHPSAKGFPTDEFFLTFLGKTLTQGKRENPEIGKIDLTVTQELEPKGP